MESSSNDTNNNIPINESTLNNDNNNNKINNHIISNDNDNNKEINNKKSVVSDNNSSLTEAEDKTIITDTTNDNNNSLAISSNENSVNDLVASSKEKDHFVGENKTNEKRSSTTTTASSESNSSNNNEEENDKFEEVDNRIDGNNDKELETLNDDDAQLVSHGLHQHGKERGLSVRSSHALDTLATFEEKINQYEEVIESDDMDISIMSASTNEDILLLKNKLEQMTGEVEKLQFSGIDSVQTVELESGKGMAKEKRKELNKRAEKIGERIVELCKKMTDIIKSRERIISSLQISISSWNVGNAPPNPDEFQYWLPSPESNYDLVVVGLQECEYDLSTDMKNLMESAKSKFKSDRLSMKLQTNTPGLNGQQSTSDGNEDSTTKESLSQQATIHKKIDRMASVARAFEKRTKRAITSNVGKHFAGLIANYLGESYFLLSDSELMQMRLFIFSKVEHISRVNNMEVLSEATGVGGVVGNKGGLFISFDFQGIRLCFTSCHLAAHEEEKYLKYRNNNCDEILGSALKRVGNKLVPYSVDWDHVFFFGDLNYRLDPRIGGAFSFSGKTRTSSVPSIGDDAISKNIDKPSIDQDNDSNINDDNGKSKKPKKYWPERDKVLEIILAKDWSMLMKIDQLKDEQKYGRTLYGFEEGVIKFDPTFKVGRGSVEHIYDEKRTPSYCDRILWTRSPSRIDSSSISQNDYISCPNVTTSDHKPVRAGFSIDLKSTLTPIAEPSKSSTAESSIETGIVLKITDLEVKNLESADVDGFADPYIIMHSSTLFPPGSDGANPSKGACKTKVLMHRLDAKWLGSSYILRCDKSISSIEHLKYRHLVLGVWDFDRLSADDVMGSAIITFDSLFQIKDNQLDKGNKKLKFDEPVIRGSHVSGRVMGQIEFLHPNTNEKTVEKSSYNGLCSANSQYCSKCSLM